MLTPDQVHFFRHCGFLKLPQPLPPDLLTRLKDAILSDVREETAPVVRDRQGRVVRLSELWGRAGVFKDALMHPVVLNPLESLLGPNIEYILNRHNHATLRLAEDGGSYMHRDILQWSRSIVTVLFYLEDATVENGCTRVIPGSHLLPGMRDHHPEKDERIARSGLMDQAVPVPMAAGDLLVIDSLVIHGPGENRTPGSRMSMTAGYHSVDELLPPSQKRVLVRGERLYMGNDT